MGDPFGLSGRVAVVTGAASGIGRGIAAALARQGARVALLDRDGEGAETAARDLAAEGFAAMARACDVSDHRAVAGAADAVAGAFGPADILVNNAGMIRPGALAELSPQDWSALLDVNLTGYFHCARAFGEGMRARGKGAIVHVGSIASEHVTPMAGAYSVAKAGVAMLSRQIAVEWGGSGIRSNCICPGMIRTPLSEGMYARPGIEEARARTIPGGRIGTVGDVAEAVLFLASDRAGYITGAEITVDGGFTRNLLGLVPRAGYEKDDGEDMA